MSSRFPVVVFDLDGTLLRGTTVSLYLAERMGREAEIAELERRFLAHEISNQVVADISAGWFAGRTRAEVWTELERAPWIGGMSDCLAAIAQTGSQLLLATITWSFAGELLKARHPFAAASGTEMSEQAGVLTGHVARHFDEHDKLRFVEDWCGRRGVEMSEVAAVGDSRSDVPLFRRVGLAIALNATEDARAAAHITIETDDLRDVLPLLQQAEHRAPELEAILRETSWFMQALEAARDVAAPDWWIAAGAIRNAAWDRLHDKRVPTPLADIDLLFFDAADLSEERDREVTNALRTRLPDLPWEANNQAAVHVWYPRVFGLQVEPFRSAGEAVATFPETATAIAVRLDAEDRIEILAPHGLDDLLGLVHRRNPTRVTVTEYERRLAQKRIAQRWPRVGVVRESIP